VGCVQRKRDSPPLGIPRRCPMPTIVAVCPYCRAGGVRAPQSAIGASATCPKCKSSFTVMPSEGLPGWAKESLPAPPGPAPAAPTTSPLPTDETRPVAAMGIADVTEPSPTLPPEERAKVRKAKPAPAPEPAPEPPGAGPGEPADAGLVLALTALILVGVAVLASQLPYGRFVALGIAVVGLVGGLASLGAEGRARQAGALAAALHVFVLMLVLLLPSWLKLDPWLGPATDEGPKGPFALEHATGQLTPFTPGNWLDAGKSSWEFKDLRVTVRSVSVGPVELQGPNGAKKTTKEPYSHLLLRVSNSGVERQIDLSGWAVARGAETIRVTDLSGKQLKPATFEDGWLPDRGKPTERLFPGKSSDVRLVFAAPPAKTDTLRIALPGSALGLADEEIKFRAAVVFLARAGVPEK